MEPTLASPNRLVWVYASASRTLAREAGETGSFDFGREKAAAAVTMAVACVETYMNVLARLWLAQNPTFEHRDKVENDLKRKKGLGRKLEEWPELFFGRKADFGSGAGQEFKSVLELRNRLMHFTSDAHDYEHENIIIRGLIDTSAYESLSAEVAANAVISAASFVEYLLQLQGIAPDRIPGAVHHWLGRPPNSV
jgi:hypothetical protein